MAEILSWHMHDMDIYMETGLEGSAAGHRDPRKFYDMNLVL